MRTTNTQTSSNHVHFHVAHTGIGFKHVGATSAHGLAEYKDGPAAFRRCIYGRTLREIRTLEADILEADVPAAVIQQHACTSAEVKNRVPHCRARAGHACDDAGRSAEVAARAADAAAVRCAAAVRDDGAVVMHDDRPAGGGGVEGAVREANDLACGTVAEAAAQLPDVKDLVRTLHMHVRPPCDEGLDFAAVAASKRTGGGDNRP